MAIALEHPELSAAWLATSRKRRLALLTVLVLALSLGIARLVLAIDVAAVAALAASITLIAIVYRPRYGVYLLLSIVLLFEPGSTDPFMLPGFYLNTSLQESLHLTGGILTPIEMLLVLTTTIWLAQGALRRRLDFRSGDFGRPMLLFAAALLFGVVRGLAGGAIFNYVFWESRFLFGLVLMYFLAVNTIRTRAQVRTLLTIVFVCVSLSAIDGVWRRFVLADAGLLDASHDMWYAHEDVVVWGLLIMLVLAQQVFGGPRTQRILGPVMAFTACFAMLVSERRAGFIAVIVSFVAFAMVLWVVKRKAFLFLAVPLVIAGAVYMPLFWNNTGVWGQPARAVRSISQPDPRDAASNAWRDLEAINVRATIQADPLIGVGFGRPFLQIVTVPSISFFEFWDYESHHNILWIWMKTGAIGFIFFFLLVTGGITRSVVLMRRLDDPLSRSVAVVAMSAIILSAVFCYVDLGLTSNRVPLVLGLSLGMLGVIERMRGAA